MSLVRALFFTAATHNFHLCIVHIPGTNNCIADHLSVSPCRLFGLQPQQQTSHLPQSSPLLYRPLSHGTARPTAGPRCGAINQANIPSGCSPIRSLLLPLSASSPPCLCPHPLLLCGLTFTLSEALYHQGLLGSSPTTAHREWLH